ncbi:hypothetical protein PENSTE_c014G03204 [Penicillium steckii]|uniref:Uncharacterized protein n=1 Tax=Penicillium steckii TaxID=303698 RepID=A0A1V6T1Q9_9EURO|nr:hypothetical protein PENSTE_c014G03204 [Penicillium steckii]
MQISTLLFVLGAVSTVYAKDLPTCAGVGATWNIAELNLQGVDFRFCNCPEGTSVNREEAIYAIQYADEGEFFYFCNAGAEQGDY